ncbi:hypothetical protein Y032_0157g3205 [Ancylostoma ceylanicum]|uniref:Uncharacterized protein n=1 Tax=Ancylostoma ceylanicum TaxID=53326 RepID=A0A016SZC8_9BILA|nr:hypothetical protein Y032_0157g3205 [Ancylostoma ceylanicum]
MKKKMKKRSFVQSWNAGAEICAGLQLSCRDQHSAKCGKCSSSIFVRYFGNFTNLYVAQLSAIFFMEFPTR